MQFLKSPLPYIKVQRVQGPRLSEKQNSDRNAKLIPTLYSGDKQKKRKRKKTTFFAGTDRQYSKTNCQCFKTRAQSSAEKYFHGCEACLEAGGCHSATVLRNDIKSELQRKHGLQIPDGCRLRIR